MPWLELWLAELETSDKLYAGYSSRFGLTRNGTKTAAASARPFTVAFNIWSSARAAAGKAAIAAIARAARIVDVRFTASPPCVSGPQVRPGEMRLVAENRGGGPGKGYAAALEHVRPVRHRQGDRRVLLDDQERRAGGAKIGQQREHVLHDERREAVRRFVEHQQGRPRD